MVVKRFEVWLINLDPTIGKEIKKTRPCIILSHDSINLYLDTIIIAPLTSTLRNFPMRINCRFLQKDGQVVLDQIRSIDQKRIIKRLGVMNTNTNKIISETLVQYFKF